MFRGGSKGGSGKGPWVMPSRRVQGWVTEGPWGGSARDNPGVGQGESRGGSGAVDGPTHQTCTSVWLHGVDAQDSSRVKGQETPPVVAAALVAQGRLRARPGSHRVRRASCVVRRASCVVRRASCVVRRASCVVRRFPVV